MLRIKINNCQEYQSSVSEEKLEAGRKNSSGASEAQAPADLVSYNTNEFPRHGHDTSVITFRYHNVSAKKTSF